MKNKLYSVLNQESFRLLQCSDSRKTEAILTRQKVFIKGISQERNWHSGQIIMESKKHNNNKRK